MLIRDDSRLFFYLVHFFLHGKAQHDIGFSAKQIAEIQNNRDPKLDP